MWKETKSRKVAFIMITTTYVSQDRTGHPEVEEEAADLAAALACRGIDRD